MSEDKVAKLSKSSKSFLLTLNEYGKLDELLRYLRKLKPGYLLCSREKAPTTGHIHAHIYCQFFNSRRLSLKKTCGANIQKCYGSPQQNVNYVKKEGDIICEEGELRNKGGKTINEIENMTREERKNLPWPCYNIVNKINSEENKKIKGNEYHKDVDVYWYWGESGVGKTKSAMKEIGDREFNEIKYDGNFWHGVTEDTYIALYDDWRDTHMKPTELINFIDYNRHIMNVKGGSVRNNYKEIYITSLQNPDEIYKNIPEESRKQWLRRIKKIYHIEIVGRSPNEEMNDPIK